VYTSTNLIDISLKIGIEYKDMACNILVCPYLFYYYVFFVMHYACTENT